MIAWLLFVGLLLLLITAPATLFGWGCGKLVCYLLRNRKSPLPPPIPPKRMP